MAETEKKLNSSHDERIDKVAKLKRELQGPLGLIQKYEGGSGEKETYEDFISKAYNDRRILEAEIKKVGTPEGSSDFGALHVEWEVKEPTVVNVRLSEGNEPQQDFDISSEHGATDNDGRTFETHRFAYQKASGYFTVYFPTEERPGVLSITVALRPEGGTAGQVLAVW